MADGASTLLKPWPASDDHAEPIITTLARINYERGGFRDLTTESLRAEAAADANADPAHAVKTDTPTVPEPVTDTKSRIEKLYQAKAELQGHVAAAQNEALMALDFVSLLISKDMPRQADQTMSPFLKQQVKPGTLGYDMWQDMAPDEAREATDTTIAKGWRMEMLYRSADSLLDAANRLRADVRKETDYWTQVLEISDSGWPVSRMPRERRVLGVRYGFSEASREFKARGVAALRSNADGTVRLELDPGACHEAPQTIRVRVVDKDGAMVFESHARRISAAPPGMQDRIRRARDSIFEQELFHEMTRETRLLGPLGVRLEGTTIKIPMSPPAVDGRTEGHIHIDLVPVTTGADGVESNSAQAMALFVRLLLTHAYRERLAIRSEPPRPLSIKPAGSHFCSILRPLLAIMRHRAAVRELETHSTALERLFAKCGLVLKTRLFDPWGLSRRDLSTGSSLRGLMSTAASAAAGCLKSTLSVSFTPDDTTASELSIRVATGAGPWQDDRFRASDAYARTGRIGSEAAIHTLFITKGLGGQSVEFDDSECALCCIERMLGQILGLAVAKRLGEGWSFDSRRGTVAFNPQTGPEGAKAVKISFSHGRKDAGNVIAKCALDVQGGSGATHWTSLDDAGKDSLWTAIDQVVNA